MDFLRPFWPLNTNLRVDPHVLHLDKSSRPEALLSIDVSDVTSGTCRDQHILHIDLFISTESLNWYFFASTTSFLTMDLDTDAYINKLKDRE